MEGAKNLSGRVPCFNCIEMHPHLVRGTDIVGRMKNVQQLNAVVQSPTKCLQINGRRIECTVHTCKRVIQKFNARKHKSQIRRSRKPWASLWNVFVRWRFVRILSSLQKFFFETSFTVNMAKFTKSILDNFGSIWRFSQYLVYLTCFPAKFIIK